MADIEDIKDGVALEKWQDCFRRGFAPGIATAGLEALEAALLADSRELAQGFTTSPPPLTFTLEGPVAAACPVTYCGWKGDGLGTVAEANGYFVRLCGDADVRLGEVAACRHLMNWIDETPRPTMRALLLVEVKGELRRRRAAGGVDGALAPARDAGGRR